MHPLRHRGGPQKFPGGKIEKNILYFWQRLNELVRFDISNGCGFFCSFSPFSKKVRYLALRVLLNAAKTCVKVWYRKPEPYAK